MYFAASPSPRSVESFPSHMEKDKKNRGQEFYMNQTWEEHSQFLLLRISQNSVMRAHLGTYEEEKAGLVSSQVFSAKININWH